MNLGLAGKIALVTGGATGIGAATAEVFCELGATVAILDIDVDSGETTARRLEKAGHAVSFHRCDVSAEKEVQAAMNDVVELHGKIDVLVSNAGIQRYGNVVDTPSSTWDEIFDIHVKGCFHSAKYAIPHMIAGGSGSIIVIASVQSFTAVTNSAAYVTVKHALLGMTRSIALDFARYNIRANCICPGSIDTPMLRRVADLTRSPEATLAALGQMHALGRIGRPEEVARAVAFLASDWASFITGTSLVVDGGLLVPPGGMSFQESCAVQRHNEFAPNTQT